MNTVALAALFVSVSQTMGLPPGLLSALCFVESRHNVQAINFNDGNGNSVGACQIKLESARFVGYHGTEKELINPEVNILWAGRYFSYQFNRYHGDVVSSLSAYNAGTARVTNRDYVRKVLNAWAEHK